MSLRVRLMAAFGYVLVLALIALVLPLALNLSKRVDAEIEAEASGQAQVVAASASGRLNRRAELRLLARTAALDLGGRVIVVDRRGRLLADSERRLPGRLSYASRPEIARALAGRAAQGRRHSDSLGQDLLVTAVPVLDRGRTVGVVRVTQSVEAVNEEKRSDVVALIAVGLGALVLGLLVTWLIAGSLARPMRALAATARRIAGGDLAARAAPAGSKEQREVTEAFNEMTDRLGRALTAQREFAADASHQLRTPLTGLRLRLEAASLKSRDPEVRRELEAAEREVERLARVVSALLALARDDERAPADASLDLSEAVSLAQSRWDAVARHEALSLVARSKGAVRARASEEDVAVILDNLIANAIRHTPSGGEVTLTWGADGPGAWLAVEDQGPGVDPAEAEHLFERFYRGNGDGGGSGTGLGLAIVRALARRWDGEAWIVNGPRGGACACVSLGAAPQRPTSAAQEAPDRESAGMR